MIAPLRPPTAAPRAPARGLATARRTVAQALIRTRTRTGSAAPRTTKLVAWLMVAWTVAVAASSFLGGWWKLVAY